MLTFEAPIGTRILRSHFYGIQTTDGLWWSHSKRSWVKRLDGDRGSNTAPCRSYKAFLRHIRKHPELTQASLQSRFAGFSIHYTKQQ